MPRYYGNEGYDYEYDYDSSPHRPPPHHYHSNDYRRSGEFLDPNATSAGLHRSRSTGHGRAPVINVFNRMAQDSDSHNRTPSPQPSYYPQPPYMQQPAYVPYPTMPYPVAQSPPQAAPRSSPEVRGRRMGDLLGDSLDVDLAEMALEHRYGRSRSRGRSDAAEQARWQLAQLEAERKEKSRERRWKLEQERITNQLKIDALEAAAKAEKADEAAKENEKRVLENYQRKQREKAEEEKRLAAEFDQKQREKKEAEKAEEQRIKDKLEKEKAAEKEKRDREYKEFKEREKAAKDEEERVWNEFLQKQKEKKEKEDKEKKEKEEAFRDEMRKRLKGLGYTDETIEVMVDEDKQKKFKKEMEKKETHLGHFQAPRAPVYPKVKTKYLEIETLKYYQLPWKYDPTNPEYIIILQDMDHHATEVLFEHTTRLRERSNRLLVEPKRDKPEFAWYRRRSRSRTGAPKQVGILRLG